LQDKFTSKQKRALGRAPAAVPLAGFHSSPNGHKTICSGDGREEGRRPQVTTRPPVRMERRILPIHNILVGDTSALHSRRRARRSFVNKKNRVCLTSLGGGLARGQSCNVRHGTCNMLDRLSGLAGLDSSLRFTWPRGVLENLGLRLLASESRINVLEPYSFTKG